MRKRYANISLGKTQVVLKNAETVKGKSIVEHFSMLHFILFFQSLIFERKIAKDHVGQPSSTQFDTVILACLIIVVTTNNIEDTQIAIRTGDVMVGHLYYDYNFDLSTHFSHIMISM